MIARKNKSYIKQHLVNKVKIVFDINTLHRENLKLIFPDKFMGDYRFLYEYYLYLLLIKVVIL
ncbi:hypothetical protein DYQ05_00970 [Treponema pedis]|nr:hypothetical protein DYQ05_00970 [Treponema pedis]